MVVSAVSSGGAVQHDDGPKSVHLDIADEAIRNQLFWAYLRMVDRLGEALSAISGWSEGCPCHSAAPALQGPRRHTVGGLRARIDAEACPLSTRRAPECAAGNFKALLVQLLRIVNSSVLLDPATLRCSEEQRTVLMCDFQCARRHINLVMSTKLAHWEQLPHVLFGIAHHDAAVARNCAARALRLFAHSGDSSTHHWLTYALCCPANGHIGYDQLVLFSQGRPLSELCFLERMAARFKFAMISERWIESRHALLKRTLYGCPHSSAVHVAYCGMQPMLRKHIQMDPQFLVQLVSHCKAVRTPKRAVSASGIPKQKTNPYSQH